MVSGLLRSHNTHKAVTRKKESKVDCDQSHCDLQVIGLLFVMLVMYQGLIDLSRKKLKKVS